MKNLLGAVLLAASAMPASAAVLVQQTPNNIYGWCSACGGGDYRGFATFSLAQDSVLQSATFTADVYNANSTVSVWSADQSQQLFSLAIGNGSGSITVSLPDWALSAGNYLFSVYDNDGLTWYGDYNGGNDYQTSGASQLGGREFIFELDGNEAAAVPEPAMLGLFGMGAIGLGLARRRKAA